MRRRLRNNKKGMSIVISTVIIIAITITMAIAVAFWAMGLGNSFTKFEKLEFVSIYADVVTPVRFGANVVQCFPVYIQLQNTGQIAVTINNVFLDGKPYSAYPWIAQTGGQNMVNAVLNVGVRNNGFYINLPASTAPGATGWKSGDYVEVEIETTSGRLYSNTVLLP